MRRFFVLLIAFAFLSLPVTQAVAVGCPDEACQISQENKTDTETSKSGDDDGAPTDSALQHSCCASAFDHPVVRMAVFLPATAQVTVFYDTPCLPSRAVGPLLEPPTLS